MPVIQIENRAALTAGMKSTIAAEITGVVNEVILSQDDLISVIFHDLPPESAYRAGVPAEETLIFCNIRAGRSDKTIQTLLKQVSATWSRITGDNEDTIEVIAEQYPAKHIMRAGHILPEPPLI